MVDANCQPIIVTAAVVSSDTPRGSNAQTDAPGPRSCEWYVTGTVAGIEIDHFDVLEYYTLAPFSNISDWQSPPYMTHDLTATGAALYSPQQVSGFAYPEHDYSPGIHAQIYVSAQTGLSYPRLGPTISTYTWRLDGHVNSPGYLTPDCTGSFTLDKTDIIHEILDAVSGSWPGWDICGWTGGITGC